MKKVAVCVGTRPDIIKMWSPYKSLRIKPDIETILIHSGQHDAMAEQTWSVFEMNPDYICVVSDGPFHLGHLVSRLIDQFTIAFYETKPDLVLVHGDTSTAFAAATAAFLQNIPIGHVEAGLRTSRFEYPFPEEGYRRAISRFTSLHFAPTPKAATNLRMEGINKGILVTGNTVVDSLNYIKQTKDSGFINSIMDDLWDTKVIMVTCHRRESYGKPLDKLCQSVIEILEDNPDAEVIWPVHSNPNINEVVPKYYHSRLDLLTPLQYNDFVKLISLASLIITDSGGVMEEAAVLGKPTIVLRTETERPEVLELDNVKLTGYDFEELVLLADYWLKKPPKSLGSNIFGEGTAGEEIAEKVRDFLQCNVQDAGGVS